MPSPSTALELIKAAMRQIGVIATGETPSAAEAADGLSALNDVLETWNLSRLNVWTDQALVFVTTPNVASYTMGPGGTFSVTPGRPVDVTGVFGSFQGVDYQALPWSYEQYLAAPVKATGALYPQRYCYINDFPLGRLFLWPVPTVALTLNVMVRQQLTAAPNLATPLTYPPGYARALQWSLAAELASQYGVTMTQQQMAMVTGTMAAIKRANHTPSVSGLDVMLMRRPMPLWPRA